MNLCCHTVCVGVVILIRHAVAMKIKHMISNVVALFYNKIVVLCIEICLEGADKCEIQNGGL